jgi:gas vesicle protein
MRSTNFGAFLLGALAGGVAALLLAPRSGAETREMIRDFAEDEANKVRGKAKKARAFVENELDNYKSKARRAIADAEELADDVKDFVAAERRKVASKRSSAARSSARSSVARKSAPKRAPRARKSAETEVKQA